MTAKRKKVLAWSILTLTLVGIVGGLYRSGGDGILFLMFLALISGSLAAIAAILWAIEEVCK